ncbi:flagellar hook-associated protein FlgK [Desertivibrio insolitus]|uniref:flagellar hook-associated protein FlgK n=1 Tax=Herbiconiux sp. SYSU D00978 TaxID=2812562 RepID=UPI001A95D5B8|nr:flagellar hook-associated protein FlgK [Herbiconiux sp. SYSU D00978]
MSGFSGLNSAYTALVAARAGMDVVGQNVANATTEGYTRQRVVSSAITAPPSVSPRAGAGVAVDSIARLGDGQLDARVRLTAATAGYTSFRAGALAAIEKGTHEPGEGGLSARLDAFWSAWADVANEPGEAAPASVLLQTAGTLVSQLAAGREALTTQWAQARSDAEALVASANDAAARFAQLNVQIRDGLAAGGSVNELLDRREVLAADLSATLGATLRPQADGTVDVVVDGDALVSGGTARSLTVAGDRTYSDAPTASVRIEWTHRTGVAVTVSGGEVAGALSVLGEDGPIRGAVNSYDAVAAALVETVNGVYAEKNVPYKFFDETAPVTAATLRVLPEQAADVTAGTGALDGSIAESISKLRGTDAGAGRVWADFVSSIGTQARDAAKASELADLAASTAVDAQQSGAAVDMDEENVNLLMYQRAYQGAARVLTTVDEMLDVLINRTGVVGR